MVNRTATCVCGALTVVAVGEPIKVSACHCQSCQKRTGSAFSVAVFFDRKNVDVRGGWQTYRRVGDSGFSVDFGFCPNCASTVFWHPEFRSEWIGIAIGCFEDATIKPTQSVYEHWQRPWVQIALP